MKILSVFFFIAALVWTWNVIHKDPQLSFETHASIQDKLSGLIAETIKVKKPSVTDVIVEKVWTEVMGPGKLKAYFVYSFKDQSAEGPIQSQIKGEGILERQADDGSGDDRWVLNKIKTSSDAVIFEDGLLVNTETTDPVPTQEEAPTTQEKTQEKQ